MSHVLLCWESLVEVDPCVVLIDQYRLLPVKLNTVSSEYVHNQSLRLQIGFQYFGKVPVSLRHFLLLRVLKPNNVLVGHCIDLLEKVDHIFAVFLCEGNVIVGLLRGDDRVTSGFVYNEIVISNSFIY